MAQDEFYRGDAAQTAPPGSGPPWQGYPPPAFPGAWRRPTNTTAILALVMAFVLAPVGVVLGVIARQQIRQTGEEGDGLALAGVIVGSVVTGIYVLMIVLMVATFSVATSFGP